MAARLAALRPEGARDDDPVFVGVRGGIASYSNVYNDILRPTLIDAGIAIQVGEKANGQPIWDY